MGRRHWSAWATPFFSPGRQPQARWDAVASHFLCHFTVLILLSLCHRTTQQLLLPRAQWANPPGGRRPRRHSATSHFSTAAAVLSEVLPGLPDTPLVGQAQRQAQLHLLAQEAS